ncbi:MAG: hypothetical protein ACLTD2_02110 [Ruminococcus sp.]
MERKQQRACRALFYRYESSDRKRLAQLVRALYLRPKHLIAKGRHLHSLDERFSKCRKSAL